MSAERHSLAILTSLELELGGRIMGSTMPYNASLTGEPFLFYEMRIVSKQYLEGKSIEAIIVTIKRHNLFQYPTERKVSKLTRACHRRLVALGNDQLVDHLANDSVEVAKQINLYAMMRYNRLVREFMVNVVGEKYRDQDFSYSRQDINMFFSRLQEQNDDVAAWSGETIRKLKQVLNKCLVETEILDSVKDTSLNPIFIGAQLETGIRENNDITALAAFNCFR